MSKYKMIAFHSKDELELWNKFLKYNKVKYCFLFFLGLLTGFIISLSIILMM